jgi:lipopolysaccharide export LptBFGC system permease protein LptF
MSATDMPWQVKAGLGAFVYLLLGAALALSYAKADSSSTSMIVGAIIGQFATVVGYYFGSSESSQKKDATIAAALPPVPAAAPVDVRPPPAPVTPQEHP